MKNAVKGVAWDAEVVQYASLALGNILGVICWTTLEPDLHMCGKLHLQQHHIARWGHVEALCHLL
jgi:hypothetical protein